MSKRGKYFVDPRRLYVEIIISKALGELTPNAQKYLLIMCKGVNSKFSYYNENYELQHDCYAEGVVGVFTNYHSFDEEKTENAFAYLTEIIKRANAKAFNEFYSQKGVKPGEEKFKILSLDSLNEGKGLHDIL